MKKKTIPNNLICKLHSAKLKSPTINNIQLPSLRSPPISPKKVYHITTNFPTNSPEQVYTTIPTSISPNHDNHNSKLANTIYKIPNLINQFFFLVLTFIILHYPHHPKPILQKSVQNKTLHSTYINYHQNDTKTYKKLKKQVENFKKQLTSSIQLLHIVCPLEYTTLEYWYEKIITS